jgi:para-nitrobenzyl esterase
MYVQPVVAETELLGRRMRRAWAAFANTGDPGWDPFTTDGLQTMVFDTEPRQQRYPHERTLEVFELPAVLDLV